MKTKITTLTMILAAVALVVAAAFPQAALAQEALTTEYRIGPKDLLEVSVFGEENMKNLVVRVSEDGKITFPLLGEVDVNGLTKGEVERKITLLLAEKYLQNPQVTVFIKEYLSKRVSVLGAVERPGTFELLGRQTLLQVISQSGGLTRDAGSEIIVIRPLADGTSTSLRIPIDDLFFKGDPNLNIPLEAGDIINVPVDELVPVYVFGQVKNPGALQVKKSNIPTLLQAIAQAGGFTDRASKSGIVIKRRDAAGKETEIKVNVKDILKNKKKDVALFENDTVYVPESLF